MHASSATAVKDFRDDARARFLRIDPLMLVATVGLIAASIIVVGSATHDDRAGDPNYFLYRQAAYAGVGFVLMLLITRFDHSRLR
jgi:rod shape determining protein RodA